jgi:uncharacterized membrane protein YkoI
VSKKTHISGLLVATTLALGGCATAQQNLDGRAFEAMKQGTKVELRVEEGGKITKVEVYQAAENKAPEAVRKLASEQLAGGKFKVYEYEVMGDGSEVHEIEMEMADGLVCEVSATGEGKLRYKECQVAPDKAPDAVKKGALAVVSGEIVEIEQKQGPGVDEYSVEIKADGVIHKIKLTPAGQVTGRSRKLTATVVIPAP